MVDFYKRNKAFILVTLATIVLLVGGIFVMTREKPTPVINSSILVPQNAVITSGFADGKYLPASSSAKVTLVEFGDYECPACAVYSPMIKQLLTENAGKLNYVFRNYPLTQHKNAPISSSAVEAAGLQGKYWEMQEKVYATQSEWSSLPDPTSVFIGFAKDLGLNTDKFTADLSLDSIKAKIQSDTNDGKAVNLTETPTFYLNGQKLILTGTFEQMKSLVTAELNK
jgi:protein-disulfide isomerase